MTVHHGHTKTSLFIVEISHVDDDAVAKIYSVRGAVDGVRSPSPLYEAVRSGADKIQSAVRALAAVLNGFTSEAGFTWTANGLPFETVRQSAGVYITTRDGRALPVVINETL